LNALNFGVPQKRERTFIVGFKENLQFSFPKPMNVPPDLKKVLDPDHEIDPELVASDAIQRRRMAAVKGVPPNPSIWHENKAGNISALPYSCALRTGASYNYLLVNGIRRLSSRELLRLQGFPDTFKIVVSHGEIRRQTGNSVAVPVIRAIARQMLKSLRAQVLADKEPEQMNLIPEQEGK
jgi:DNA (cytosine-5)-methyltransferase 1